MTNAFNLLDNMDGLAATLAAIACAFFAIDALTVRPERTSSRRSRSPSPRPASASCRSTSACTSRPPCSWATAAARCSGSRSRRSALVGELEAGRDRRSRRCCCRSSCSPCRSSTRRWSSIVRLLEGRPIYQGGRDHTSHRLVYYGLSEKRAVVLLGARLGRRSARRASRYNVLDDTRMTLVGVLLTFVLLVQFGSYLADVERGPVAPRRTGSLLALAARAPAAARRGARRLRADHGRVHGRLHRSAIHDSGTPWQRHVFNVSLPVILVGALHRVHRRSASTAASGGIAGARDAAGDRLARCCISEAAAFGFLAATQDWSGSRARSSCSTRSSASFLVGASRFWRARGRSALAARPARPQRAPPRADRRRRARGPQPAARAERDRRASRSSASSTTTRACWGRRLQGVRVLGGARRDRPGARARRIPTPCS